MIWGMLRNPAYAGRAVFGKTQAVHEQPGLNRVARLQGRTTPRPVKTVDRPREEWTEIAVPAIVDEDTFARVQQRLADNKKFATRGSKVPVPAAGPGRLRGLRLRLLPHLHPHRPARRSTTTGAWARDNYRYEGGRVCGNKPVRADYLDTVVWDHITGLLADPALIRAEIGKRPGAGPHLRPGHPPAHPDRTRPGQGRRLDHRHDRGLLRAADHDRRAARPHAATCAPAKPACAASSTPSTPRPPTATPTSSSPTTWKASSPGSAATAATATIEDRQAGAAAAGQGRPHRPGEDHHPPPHPGPGTGRQRRRPPRHNRHGG